MTAIEFPLEDSVKDEDAPLPLALCWFVWIAIALGLWVAVFAAISPFTGS